MIEAMILWRRLDTPGHDACRLERRNGGWHLEGTAVFRHEGAPARLGYHVACHQDWTTREGRVRGWLGAQTIDLVLVRTPENAWTMNGAALAGSLT